MEAKIIDGHLWWISDGQRKDPHHKSFFIFVPPFSWTMEHCADNTTLKIRGLISCKKLTLSKLPPGPVLFYSKKSLPKNEAEVISLLRSSKDFEFIGTNSNPSQLAERTKQLIDKHYHQAIEIQEIATKLKSSPAALSRKFKSDFGETPAFYRKGLRITVGMYELMMGTPPIQAAERAGYQDLSRFYKQFKSYLKQTPAEYLKKSKNAKK